MYATWQLHPAVPHSNNSHTASAVRTNAGYSIKLQVMAFGLVLLLISLAYGAVQLGHDNASRKMESTKLREVAALHPRLVYTHANTSYSTNSTGMQWLQHVHAAAGTSDQFAL